MVFPCSYGFPTDFLWFSHGFELTNWGTIRMSFLAQELRLGTLRLPARKGWLAMAGYGWPRQKGKILEQPYNSS